MRALNEGRLTVSFVDNGNFYTRWGKQNEIAKEWPGYLREDGRHSSFTIQDNIPTKIIY